MYIRDFIAKWQASSLKERSASQEHFIDVCRLLGQQTPSEADPQGLWYTFEKGAAKQGGGQGFADVWRKGCFAWEYKAKAADLNKAYDQLLRYRSALENPPLLIVSDMDVIEIHTNFTNTPEIIHRLSLADLDQPEALEKLKWIFVNPENFRPGITVEQITTQAAEQFARLAQTLRERGHAPQAVAHFLSKLVFCLFAEDVGLLPKNILGQLIENAGKDLALFNEMLAELLLKMNSGGRFGVQRIRHFNGGLFSDDLTLPLQAEDIPVLEACSRLDWGKVEPSILGTLFERGLDPAKRSQLGAHYTPRADMERVVDPVMMEPLRREWINLLAQNAAALDKASASGHKASLTKAQNESRGRIQAFLAQVRGLRVLDPACGSGNFLYVALERLHSLEKDILYRLADLEGGQMSLDIQIGPHQVFGLELNPYAAELARVTVWIGHLQWMIQNGFGYAEDPILQNLENIQQRDAILDLSGPEPQIPDWPEVDFIVGNPPFLGDKKMLSELGESYTKHLRKLWKAHVPGQADLVCYWFAHAQMQLEKGRAQRAGFVSTNSIRGGKNRAVLDQIVQKGRIFTAWSDDPWVVDGAAVRISLVCFGGPGEGCVSLDGQEVEVIYADLTAPGKSGELDLTESVRLAENRGVSFIGTQKNGPFTISGTQAREWLQIKGNPNGKANSDVLRPWANAMDLTKRASDTWIIDFGVDMSEDDAELYEVPFEYIKQNVQPIRKTNRDKRLQERWWIFEKSRGELRQSIQHLVRIICTPMVAKHRLFVWLPVLQIPENLVVAIARDDDTSFGILHSRFHELWSLGLCTWLGKGNDPRYTPSTTFETFPFPPGLTPNLPPTEYSNPQAEAIGEAARRLNELRENWLNPPELVQRVPEGVPGYPERILPKDAEAEKELKKRTLTHLYNARPAWLVKAHARLDEAVAAAYGWPADLPDQEVLAHLLALNRERSQ